MTELVVIATLATMTLQEAKLRTPGWAPPDPPSAESLEGSGYALFEIDPQPSGDYLPGDVRLEDGRYIRGWREAELSQDELMSRYETAVQGKLNSAAIAAKYDSIENAVSYAEEPSVPKFQMDGKAFRTWRSLVWAYAYDQLALVLAGAVSSQLFRHFYWSCLRLNCPPSYCLPSIFQPLR